MQSISIGDLEGKKRFKAKTRMDVQPHDSTYWRRSAPSAEVEDISPLAWFAAVIPIILIVLVKIFENSTNTFDFFGANNWDLSVEAQNLAHDKNTILANIAPAILTILMCLALYFPAASALKRAGRRHWDGFLIAPFGVLIIGVSFILFYDTAISALSAWLGGSKSLGIDSPSDTGEIDALWQIAYSTQEITLSFACAIVVAFMLAGTEGPFPALIVGALSRLPFYATMMWEDFRYGGLRFPMSVFNSLFELILLALIGLVVAVVAWRSRSILLAVLVGFLGDYSLYYFGLI